MKEHAFSKILVFTEWKNVDPSRRYLNLKLRGNVKHHRHVIRKSLYKMAILALIFWLIEANVGLIVKGLTLFLVNL